MAMTERSVAVAGSATRVERRRLTPALRESLQGVGLMTPTLLLLFGLVLYPFVYAIWLAFTDKAVGSPGQFVGFKNFAYVIHWPQFSAAIWNTVVFTGAAIIIKFVLGMAVAL